MTDRLAELREQVLSAPRDRNAIEAELAHSTAVIDLVLHIAYSRQGRADLANDALARADAALLDDVVHGTLRALACLRAREPSTVLRIDDVAPQIDALSRYKVGRLLQAVPGFFAPHTTFDPFTVFNEGPCDPATPPHRLPFTVQDVLGDPGLLQRLAYWHAAVLHTLPDRDPDDARAVLTALAAEPMHADQAAAALLLARALDHTDAAAVFTDLLATWPPFPPLLEPIAALDPALGRRLLDACEPSAELHAARLATGLEPGSFDWDGAFAESLAVRRTSERLLRLRPLARIAGYEGRPDRLLKLFEHAPWMTDAFNTNSHYCLTLVAFFASLAEGTLALEPH